MRIPSLLVAGVLLAALILTAGRACGADTPLPSERAAALLAAGDSAGALVFLERELDKDSKDYAAFLLRGQLRLAHGEYKKAEVDFHHALFSKSNVLRSEAHVGLGNVILAGSEKHAQQALVEYRIAADLDPSSRPALYSIASSGFKFRDTQGSAAASRALTRLICLDPEYRDALELWSEKLVWHDEAELRAIDSSFTHFLETDPGREYLGLYVARERFRRELHREAIQVLKRLEKQRPDFKPAERELLRARCCLALNDTTGFDSCYNRSLKEAARDGDFEALIAEAEAIFTPEEAAKWEQMKTSEQKADFFRAFWARRDPDPLTPFNERRVTHYARLGDAQKYLTINNPHSFFQLSSKYQRLVTLVNTGDSGPYEYDPGMFFQRCRRLVLDPRGLLFVRHGPPDHIDQFSNDKMDTQWVWRYGSVYFPFTAVSGGGVIFQPIYARGIGNITRAMQTESFRDPLPYFRQAYLGVDFRGPDGRLELLFFQSVPQDSVATGNGPFSDLALFDSTWGEVARDSSLAWPVAAGSDSLWLVANRAQLPPGVYNLALRLDVPGRRAVRRQRLTLLPYAEKSLDLSGIMLGAHPERGRGLFSRHGAEINPRPSLRFAAGEMIAVYLEVYNLGRRTAGSQEFRERVTVTLDEKKSTMEKLIPFRSRKGEKSLSLTFERVPEKASASFPETFDIDTSPLLPGVYSLKVEITDRTSGTHRTRGCTFEIRDHN